MFTLTKNSFQKYQSIDQERAFTTWLPSPLVLIFMLENGWKVEKIELTPSEDQLGLIYLVTFCSDGHQGTQTMLLPRTDLIQKILEDNLYRIEPTLPVLMPAQL